MYIPVVRIAALSFMVSVAALVSAQAFDAKQITLKVGYGPGGTYDLSSRLLARYLGEFLPGKPEIVVQNVPGGGSLKLAKLMLGSEPADGSVIASISPNMAFAPLLDPENVDLDASSIVWLGALSSEPAFCATTKASGIDTMEKFLSGSFHVGASAKNSPTYQQAAIAKHGLGAKFDIVVGFSGAAEIELAMERGELAGHCSVSVTELARRGVLKDFNIIGRFGSKSVPAAPDVPRFSAMIDDPVVRQAAEFIEAARDINYPLMVPPGASDDTVRILRDAYTAAASDPRFVAEAQAMGEFTLSATSGEEMTAIIKRQLQADDAIIAAARKLVE